MKKWAAVWLIFMLITLFAGVSLAYFTHRAEDEPALFTVGVLNVDITRTLSPDSSDWRPGAENAKRVEWSFTNTGSKSAFVRAFIHKQWNLHAAEAIIELPLYGALYPEVHAASAPPGEAITDWRLVQYDKWVMGDDGYWYLCMPLGLGETADLSFDINLLTAKNFLGAEYALNLRLEYIQACSQAVSHHWSGSPCLTD